MPSSLAHQLSKEALAKDVDLTTPTKTALGNEQSRKSCGTMKTTREPIQRINTPSTSTQEQVDQIVACIMAGKYSSRVRDKDKSTKSKKFPNCPPFYKPHEPNRCPAKGKTFVVCKEKHHFVGFPACQATTIKSVTEDPDTEAYQFPQAPAPTTGINKLEVIEIHCLLPEDTHNRTQLTVNQHGIEFFVDSGCRKTLLPLQLYQPTMGPLQPSQTKFHPYGTTSYLPIAGQLPATLQTRNGATHSTTIYVIDGHGTEPLLGDTDAKALGILTINRDGYTKEHKETGQHTEQVAGITSNLRAAGITINSTIIKDETITPEEQARIHQLLEKHQDIFSGIGLLKDDHVNFHIDPTVLPVAAAYHPVPLACRTKLNEHLATLWQQNKIEDVNPDDYSP